MKKSARQLRSMMRNRTRTRSWSKKGLRSPRSAKPKLGIIRSRKKSIVSDIPLSYTHIECNDFVHRGHKQLAEDDIPICACKYVKAEPESACGDRCLNVLTSNECTPGFCPCGEFCRNQRFQFRKYIKTKLVKTDERGWGLLAAQDVKMGEFVIEYCGEVISCQEARSRSQAYEAEGLQDAYIISLSGSESIDATRKGSLARFINHSCEPNCETRKWTVLGEVRVGIFAKQDIKAGTELTYNYNFEWYGGAKVRCRCGASSCVGFLGAKSRGFQKDSYVWEDNDDRYSVENVPLYDSEDDELLSNFFKRAQVSNKLRKAGSKSTAVVQLSLVESEAKVDKSLLKGSEDVKTKSSLDVTAADGNQQIPVLTEKHLLQEEVIIGNRDVANDNAPETALSFNLEEIKEEAVMIDAVRAELICGPVDEEKENIKSTETAVEGRTCLTENTKVCETAVVGSAGFTENIDLPQKRQRLAAPEQSKNIVNKCVTAQSICRLLSSKMACDEVLAAEEVHVAASTELDKLHDKLRPMIEELGKDGPDNLPIVLAEDWIAATCKQLKAAFDFNFSVVRHLTCSSSGISSKTQLPN